jgi:hypothetical protein
MHGTESSWNPCAFVAIKAACLEQASPAHPRVLLLHGTALTTASSNQANRIMPRISGTVTDSVNMLKPVAHHMCVAALGNLKKLYRPTQ